MERNEIKRFILNFIELQKERATLQEQIVSLENNLKKTTYALENAKENKARIENSSISIFFLGVLGKKEERLEQEEIKVRRAKETFNSAQFEFDSANERMQSVITEITSIEGKLEKVLDLLKDENNSIKENIVALKEISNMRYLIAEDIKKMKYLSVLLALVAEEEHCNCSGAGVGGNYGADVADPDPALKCGKTLFNG